MDDMKTTPTTWNQWAERAKEKLAGSTPAAVAGSTWDAALDRMVDDARKAADAHWRDVALNLADSVDGLSALVVGIVADGIEEPLRGRLVAATKRAQDAAAAFRRADV